MNLDIDYMAILIFNQVSVSPGTKSKSLDTHENIIRTEMDNKMNH